MAEPMSNMQDDHLIAVWAQSISRLFATYHELSSAIATHGTSIGNSREFFVTEALRRFLPQALHIGTGQIIGIDNCLSNQVDIVIYRPDCPVLSSLAMPNVYFSAGVLAALEIKSNLTGGEKGTLWEALANSMSVKKSELDYSSKNDDPTKNFVDLRHILPSTYVFGFRGYKADLVALRQTISEWHLKHEVSSLLHLPDVIVSEGCIVLKNDYRFFDSNAFRQRLGFNPIFLAARDDNPLQWLLYHLLSHLSHCLGPVSHSYSGIRLMLPRNHLGRRALEEKAEFWGKWDFEKDKGRILELG